MKKNILLTTLILASASRLAFADSPVPHEDGRSQATMRLDAKDQGVVLRHGDGPNQCDYLGARDIWVWESGGTYFMHYDGAGTNGWLACLATSKDLTNWTKLGPVLQLKKSNEDDSASASYGTTYFDGTNWHMFYLGTPNATPAPDLVPSPPYLTMKAHSASPNGPWVKEPEIVPFRPSDISAANYGASDVVVASPGMIIKSGDEYMMFVSGGGHSAKTKQGPYGHISIARTKDLNGKWTFDPKPMLPWDETCENASLYFEPANQTWFLFCNHINAKLGCTDAVWVYWTKDLNHWNSADKAVVLDGSNCRWSRKCIGLPSVVKVGNRLAIFYDAPGGDSNSHMKRDVGLAWLELPLNPQVKNSASTNEITITVVSYYFGNYHPGDPRNVKTKGADWSEWELVKNAKPRFPGHQQPHVPLWGYQDESDPGVMANKINAAADYGISAFIFDWYYYNDGPFLDRPIDRGFLQATNNARLKFAFMWANHDWQDIFPYHHGTQRKTLYPGRVTPEAFEKICDHLIKDYFTRTNYWRIDGKPYFSFYDLGKLLESFGFIREV